MKFYRILLLLMIASPTFTYSQLPFCGFDELRNSLYSTNPHLQEQEKQMHERVYRAILNEEVKRGAGTVIVIPLVFHIMHNNGPENVPDSVIINTVNELNLRFQNSAPYYDSTGNIMNFEFCLATVDPQGNPTTGITRNVTTLTNIVFATDDEDMKNLNRWSPLLYCNIWVVSNIFGNPVGYATYPNWAGIGVDGIVMEAAYLTNSYVLAHEVGHYCGLAHTFSFSCTNFNCLLDGDQVCDTPPDTSQLGFPCMWNSCSTDAQDTTGFGPFIVDENELPNYMDYTNCPLSFTQGQGERMEILVTMYRSLLFNSNGCGANPGQALPLAGFNFSVSPCNNGEVSFSDSTSINSLTTEWDFNNDGIYEFLGHDFAFTFPASGTYLVKQRVTGFGGQDSTSQIVSVLKGSTYNYPITFPAIIMDTLRVCAGDTITFTGDTSGVSYLWSTGETTQTISFPADTALAISLSMIDSSGLTWTTQCTPIYVEVYPNDIPIITYDDTVGYSCQGDLLTLYITNPVSGIYTWYVYYNSIGWFNTVDHNLTYNHIPDPYNGTQYYVTYTNDAGCTQQSNIITVQPHFLPFLNGVPLFSNGFDIFYGNSPGIYQYQWYNYNIPIPGATSYWYTVTSTGCYQLRAWDALYPYCDSYTDTICFFFTALDELKDNISVSPNPVKDILTVTGLQSQLEKLEYNLWNILGNEIVAQGKVENSTTFNIDCSSLSSGIYILQITLDEKFIRKKIIVTQSN